MEFLIVLIFIGMIISSQNKAQKKSQQQKRAMEGRKQTMQQYARPTAPAAGKPKAAPRTAVPVPTAPMSVPTAPVTEMQPERAAAAHEPIRHTAMEPTVQVTKHTDDIFDGSMAMHSTEGYDPCHEDELHEAVNPCELSPEADAAPAAATGGLGLEWNGNALVKAMVMQEVLTRPCDRVRR